MNERNPERIYNWLSSQLSIARFYGGIQYNGAHYVIAMDEEGQPLVREDVKFPRKAKPQKKRKTVKLVNVPAGLPLPPNV